MIPTVAAGVTALTLLVTPFMLQISNRVISRSRGHPNGAGATDLEMAGLVHGQVRCRRRCAAAAAASCCCSKPPLLMPASQAITVHATPCILIRSSIRILSFKWFIPWISTHSIFFLTIGLCTSLHPSAHTPPGVQSA
jgi:hypothetical protein